MRAKRKIEYYVEETTHKRVTKKDFLEIRKSEINAIFVSMAKVAKQGLLSEKEIAKLETNGKLHKNVFKGRVFFRRDELKAAIKELPRPETQGKFPY